MILKHILSVALLLPCLILFGQNTRCDDPNVAEADIKVFSPDITPNPLASVLQRGTGHISFILGNDNGSYQEGDVELEVTLTDLEAIEGISAISSEVIPAGLEVWDWEYDQDAHILRAKQIKEIPNGYAEKFEISIRVTANSTQQQKSNGFRVDAKVVNDEACNASTTNDHVERRTYTEVKAELPAEVVLFEGEKIEKSVQLQWEIINHELLEMVTLEHSSDGENWAALDTIEVVASTELEIRETYMDQNPVRRNYYKLTLEEVDGRVSNSNVVEINFHLAAMEVFPNPTNGDVRIKGLEEGEYAILYDAIGKELMTIRGNAQVQEVRLATTVRGTYNLARFAQDGTSLGSLPLVVH